MGPRCFQYNDAGQATVHKQIPEFLADLRGDGQKYGSEYPFEVIWIYPKQGCELSLFWPNLITSRLIDKTDLESASRENFF